MKHKLGQYFTTNIELKKKVLEFILNSPDNILEPSIGRGDLVEFIIDKIPDIKFDMYEIDKTIKLLDKINVSDIIYDDFIIKSDNIVKRYKTIIGNPPYVKTKGGNLYIDFIEKCYNLLENNGELIFIIPSDFFKLTSSSKLLNNMMKNGSFTHIFHPHNENMFDDASIDIIIFRYCKNNTIEKKVLYNDILLYIINSDGLITFNKEKASSNIKFSEYFDIYVGLVNGKENVYKNDVLGNINVLNAENKLDKYIFIKKYPSEDVKINQYLLKHKSELLQRRIKKFNEDNWFQWGAPRNIKTIESNKDKDCIYICNLTRQENVAFIDKVQYFGGSLIMLKPKKKCDLKLITDYLNNNVFKDNFMFSGRFKIGHRQISNSFIPREYI